MGYFDFKYSKIIPTKDCRHDITTRNKFNRQQENNAIFNHEVDEIIMQENNKVNAEDEAHENIDSVVDKNDIYHIDNII